jgi:arsenate reductase
MCNTLALHHGRVKKALYCVDAITQNTAAICQEPKTMSDVTIYHNPRCSKSRQTLELLQQKGVNADVVEYLSSPPNTDQLDHILTLLQLEPRQLMRCKEAEYKEHGMDNPNLTRKQLIALMVQHPKVIERPIVIRGGKAAIGRPPETVLEIL